MAKTTILAEQTLDGFAYSEYWGSYALVVEPNPFSLTVGETYEVVWDGTSYEVVGQDAGAILPGTVALGNASAWGMQGNGEPFALGQVEGGVTYFSLDTSASHTIAIYQGTDELISVILKDEFGTPRTYEGVEKVLMDSPSGVKIPFSYGEVLDGTEVELDFSSGDQTVSVPRGYLVKEATIKKPDTLLPENIAKDVNVAGIVGTRGGTPVETTVDLDFSDGNMEVLPDADKLFSKVSIAKPEMLTPENIAKDVNVAGIIGSHEGGGGEIAMEDKPIRFYNAYGDVIYGYTLAEIQELEALPAGPAISGATFSQWTHTLAELKTTLYFADVGPMYKYGSYTASVLIIETMFANESVTLCFGSGGYSALACTVYWGDGSNSSVSVSSGTYRKNTSHTYATAGEHIVIIANTSGTPYLGGYTSANISQFVSIVGNTTVQSTTSSVSYFVLSNNNQLKSLVSNGNSIMCCVANNRLRFISAGSVYIGGYLKCAMNNPALAVIAGKAYVDSNNYVICNATSLKRVTPRTWLNDNMIVGADSLEEVLFGLYGNYSIEVTKLNNQWAMLMVQETPPTISAANPVWGTKPIYVPDSAVEAYKAAEGWSSAAAYIFPASQYHVKH